MTKISSLTAQTGAAVDTAADLLPIVDMSLAGTARNKKITVDELAIALAEAIRDTIGTALTAGTGVTVTVNDPGDTITIAVDTTAEAERVRDVIGTALVAGTNVTITVNDPSDTITIDASAGSVASLDDVGDVNAPTPSNGDVLTWDSTPGEWVPQAVGAGYTAENARDDVGAALVEGTGIDITVDDGADTITIAVAAIQGCRTATGQLTTQNFSAGASVPWAAADVYDTNSMHDPASSNTNVVIPSGWDWVDIGAFLHLSAVTAGSTCFMEVRKNGGTIGIGQSFETGGATAGPRISGFGTIQVTSGDVITMFFQSSDTSLTIENDSCLYVHRRH